MKKSNNNYIKPKNRNLEFLEIDEVIFFALNLNIIFSLSNHHLKPPQYQFTPSPLRTGTTVNIHFIGFCQ